MRKLVKGFAPRSNRAFTLVVALLLLSVMVIPVQFLKSAHAWNASETIYVHPDGSIEPSSAPISKVGNAYMMTDDIMTHYDGIVFMANDSILDGGGHMLGSSNPTYGTGLEMDGLHNVEVRNVVVENFSAGLSASNSSALWIHDNSFTNNTGSIQISGTSANLNITRNTFLGRNISSFLWNDCAVYVDSNISHAIISGNIMQYCGEGIVLQGNSVGASILDNSISSLTGYGIGLLNDYKFSPSGVIHRNAMIIRNTIEEHADAAAIYAVNTVDMRLSENLVRGGGLSVVSSLNCTACNNSAFDFGYYGMGGIQYGMYFSNAYEAKVTDNTISNYTGYGIGLSDSYGSTVSRNHILHGKVGLTVFPDVNNAGVEIGGSMNDSIVDNEIGFNQGDGIRFDYSNNTLISGNLIHDNGVDGICWRYGASSAIVRNNTITSNGWDGIIAGAKSSASSPITVLGIIIRGNNVSGNDNGVILNSASNSLIIENTILSNHLSGILLEAAQGIWVMDNQIRYNRGYRQSESDAGISFQSSSRNFVYGNVIDSNHYIDLYFSEGSTDNRVYHNALNSSSDIDCSPQTVNSWDVGYPVGGNLWSGYQGTDLYHGSFQNEKGSDGIYDQPYVIDASNTDRYPLVRLENRSAIWLDPVRGGNVGNVTVRLYGLDSTSISSAKLVRAGRPPIGAMDVFTINGIVYATFDLRQQEPGVYDLMLMKNDSSTTTVSSSFTIIAGGGPELKVDLVGRDKIMKGGNGTYYIRISNVGDIDSGWTLLRLMADYPTQIYKVSCILDGAPLLASGDTQSWRVIKGTVFDKNEPLPFGQENFLGLEDLIVWNVPAGGSLLYEVQIHCDRNETDPFVLAMILPWSPWTAAADYCVNLARCLIAHGATNNPYAGYTFADLEDVWFDALKMTASDYTFGLIGGGGVGRNPETAISLGSFFLERMNMALFSVPYMSTYFATIETGMFLYQSYMAFKEGAQAEDYAKWKASNYYIQWHTVTSGNEMAVKQVRPVVSFDPNEIDGPQGFGIGGFTSHTGRYDYVIFFENMANATAPAERIAVTDQLDPNLDWSTLMAGPMNPAQNVTVDFNSTTGIITWTFENISLPPDKVPPEGEGYVSYSVAPKDGLPSGTEISAGASIVFDYNAPLATNIYVNTIDIAPPSSSVIMMSPTQLSNFPVSWQGSDGTGSGISLFSVFVSVDEGAFALWKNMTNATSASFNGTIGHTYAFYSVAYDNVGNIESAPSNPDLMVTIVASPLPIHVTVRCEPSSVTSGERSMLNITVMSEGAGVAGASITLSCSDGGSMSSVTDLGGGYYSAVYISPNVNQQTNCSVTVSVEKTGFVSNATSVIIMVNPTAPAPPAVIPIEIIGIIAIAVVVAIAAIGVGALMMIRRRRA